MFFPEIFLCNSGCSLSADAAYTRVNTVICTHIAADVHASWKEVKCLCLNSLDMAFTQHKQKVKKPVDKEIFERNMKLQADLWRIRGVHDSITIFIG